MKAEENKKNIELNDKQLDDVTGGKNPKRKIEPWSHGHHDLLILATYTLGAQIFLSALVLSPFTFFPLPSSPIV